MIRVGSRSIKSWILVYAGFLAAIVFAENGIAMTSSEHVALSPVLIQSDAPALQMESVVRRSDI